MDRVRLFLCGLVLVCAGCPPEPPTTLPPMNGGSGTPTPPPGQPGGEGDSPAEPGPASGGGPGEPAPVAPTPADEPPLPEEKPPVTHSFDEIMEELAQIEDMGIDYDDSMGDYERRLERPRVLLAEAAQMGLSVEQLTDKLIELRKLQEGLGHVQRPFLFQLLARQPDAVGGVLRKLSPEELAGIAHELPEEGEAFQNQVSRWYLSLARFAKTTGNDASEAQRIALLEAYSARKAPAAVMTPLVAEDPSEQVKAHAAQLLR